jgi:diguanylate cyclase (GGDEF)-like protein
MSCSSYTVPENRDGTLIHDQLTGVATYPLFLDRLGNALARRSRDKRPLAVLVVALDEFSLDERTVVPLVDDLLLLEASTRLRKCVRDCDLVARFGAFDFAILLEDAEGTAAETVARRIVDEHMHPLRLFDQDFNLRIRVGVTVAHAHETPEVLLTTAQLAMRAALKRGDVRHVVSGLERIAAPGIPLVLRHDLVWAIQRGELEIDYQPIINLADGTVSGFEALLRWNHPALGRLKASEFLDLAEESGLILSIGGWVLRTACSQVAAWRRTHGRDYTVSINVSALQFKDPRLIAKVSAALVASDLVPQALALEFTECITVEDPESAVEVIRSLKEIGVVLCMDNFGAGVSFLSALRQLHLDVLKIDRSLTADLANDSDAVAFLSSVVGLGHSLGLRVVAEGIESVSQLETIRSIGCDQSQGSLWRIPASPQDVSLWLDSLGEIDTVVGAWSNA